MNLWFVVYTKNNCTLCKKALELLQVYGVDYYEYNVDLEPLAKEFIERNKLNLPYAMIEESHIGNYLELEKYIRSNWFEQQKKSEQKWKPTEKLSYRIPGGQKPTGGSGSDSQDRA